MDTRISGNTRLMGVIGSPIRHSGSPVMYNFCFDYYGLDCVYLAFECDESQVPETLAAFRRLNLRGGNVTMPCKQAVARNVDRLEGAARFIGAANTIVNDKGVLTGYITDGMGVVLDLQDHGISVRGKDIVLLGAGGAANAIMVQCALDGAASVTVFNRSLEALERAEAVGKKIMAEGVECNMVYQSLRDEAALVDAVRNAHILINATSVGMRPKTEGLSLITDMSLFREDLVVYDVIYNPAETKLMADARAHGCKTVIGGKGMLMWQGAGAFKLFTGLEMPTEELKKILAEREAVGAPQLKDVDYYL